MKNIVFLFKWIIILLKFAVECEITYIEVKYPLKVRYEEYLHKFCLSGSHLKKEKIEDK
jgi:hypothetical protein